MTLGEFETLITGDESLHLIGIIDCETDNPKVLVKHKPTSIKTSIPLKKITSISADDKSLMPMLRIERDTSPLHHMSRVVGYMSRLESWNASKIGELKDRIKGSYAFDGTAQTGRAAAMQTAESLSS